jgi:hypothetical protein
MPTDARRIGSLAELAEIVREGGPLPRGSAVTAERAATPPA